MPFIWGFLHPARRNPWRDAFSSFRKRHQPIGIIHKNAVADRHAFINWQGQSILLIGVSLPPSLRQGELPQLQYPRAEGCRRRAVFKLPVIVSLVDTEHTKRSPVFGIVDDRQHIPGLHIFGRKMRRIELGEDPLLRPSGCIHIDGINSQARRTSPCLTKQYPCQEGSAMTVFVLFLLHWHGRLRQAVLDCGSIAWRHLDIFR